jgi:hypothetical protein
MKLCYALRRGVYYPSQQDLFGTMPPKEHRPGYLKLVKSYGFDGVEIPAGSQSEMDAGQTKDFGQELKDAGLPALCVRAGGPIAHHTAGPGEVLVSSTVKDLVAGAGLAFEPRGTHVLRGVPDEWRLFAVVGA